MRIWGVPPAGGPLLWLPTAQGGRGNYPNSYLQNLANDGTPNSVQGVYVLLFFLTPGTFFLLIPVVIEVERRIDEGRQEETRHGHGRVGDLGREHLAAEVVVSSFNAG